MGYEHAGWLVADEASRVAEGSAAAEMTEVMKRGIKNFIFAIHVENLKGTG